MLHLFHPAVVHLTVAFLLVGGLIEATALLAQREDAARFGARLFVIGAASLVFTVLTGYLAENSLDPDPAAARVLESHELNGWLLLAAVVAALFWKGWHRGKLPAGQGSAYALFLIFIAGLVLYGGWLGGRMVYVHGLGVQ